MQVPLGEDQLPGLLWAMPKGEKRGRRFVGERPLKRGLISSIRRDPSRFVWDDHAPCALLALFRIGRGLIRERTLSPSFFLAPGKFMASPHPGGGALFRVCLRQPSFSYLERTTSPTMLAFEYQTATSSLSGQLQKASCTDI